MLGDKALELIKNLTRDCNDPMPAYCHHLVQRVVREMNELNSKIEDFILEKLKRLRWELGSVLPQDIIANLSEPEIKWFLYYSNNLSDYMNKLNEGKGLDLTLHKKPPKSLYIQVRCNTEYGDYELEDGTTVLLSKDSMHYLPLSQCEKLILGGVLEQIKQ